MTYGRATSSQEIDPEVVQILAERLGFEVTSEEAKGLAVALLNQFAAMDSMEQFDLRDTAPILKMKAKWDE